MSYEYRAVNFLSYPTETDKRIKIYDKDNNLVYNIEPDFSYIFVSSNCVVIKITNKNDIILSFENKDEANLAMQKLLNIGITEETCCDDGDDDGQTNWHAPYAPLLSYTNYVLTGTTQLYSGKTSFGLDNEISGYSSGSLSVGDSVVLSRGDGDLSGVFADNVETHLYAYEENAFKNKGVIKISYVYSGSTIEHEVNLDTIPVTSYNQTLSGITITLSEIKYCKFSNGVEDTDIKYRTGTWSIDNSVFSNGVNLVNIYYNEVLGVLDPYILISSYLFVVDDYDSEVIVSNSQLGTMVLGGSKYLSGIHYYTSGSTTFNTTLRNVYRNTYIDNGEITFNTVNCLVNPINISDISGSSAHEQDIDIDTSAIVNVNRIINDVVGVSIDKVDRTLDKNEYPNNSIVINGGVLLDNTSSNSTNLIEEFDDESYRLKDTTYNNVLDIINLSNTWDSTEDLNNNGGLQVINGNLEYPTIDFSSIINAYPNPDYSSISGETTYIRKFRFDNSISNMVLLLSGTSTTSTFKASNDFSGDYIHLEAKIGKYGNTLTEWKDCLRTNANGGCLAQTYGVGGDFNINWGLSFFYDSTAYSDGYVLIKISTNSNVEISKITLSSYT